MRTTSGTWRVAKDFPNLPAWIVKAVGGSTTHWAGASLRFQEHEFKIKSVYGDIAGANLLDWPITLAEMEPWYAKAEDKMGVTRTNGIPRPARQQQLQGAGGRREEARLQESAHRQHGDQQPAARRARRLPADRLLLPGLQVRRQMVDALHRDPQGRGDRQSRGAAATAWRSRSSTMRAGKVTGVVYADEDGTMQRQKARVVAVAGNSIESPRLLLNSASTKFPDGLANCSGQVGRNYMRHMTGSVYAAFDKPVHMYRGTTMAGIIRDEAKQRSEARLRRRLRDGDAVARPAVHGGVPQSRRLGPQLHQRDGRLPNMAGMWLVGEDMPQETNRVTLDPKAKDKFGMPVASVHFDDHPNDIAMRDHAYRQGAAVYEAVGATVTFPTPPYPSTHNLGTNRMSEKPRDGVVNKCGQTHDIKNLFVSDGSQFTTGAACNPTLTIVTLAIRQADYIAGAMQRKEI